MIVCIVGTRAQLIKMAPVIREAEARQYPLRLILTGQHKASMAELLVEFSIRTQPTVLYDGSEASGILRMAGWLIRVLWRLYRNRQTYLPECTRYPDRCVIVVHGDTFSTLLGALVGKLMGVKVAHVESGLRSFNLLHPFPEELTRLAVFRLTDIAYCPGAFACKNMIKYRSEIVDIGHNTIVDALKYALNKSTEASPGYFDGVFGVCSIHRFENIFIKSNLLRVVELIELAAKHVGLVFVLHPPTQRRLLKCGLYERLARNDRIVLLPRMGYTRFVGILAASRFVITDGGSNQEELSYLGIPTLLMRKATERVEGLGSTVVVGEYREDTLHRFIAELATRRRGIGMDGHIAPSKIIVDRLSAYVDKLPAAAASKVAS